MILSEAFFVVSCFLQIFLPIFSYFERKSENFMHRFCVPLKV